MMRRRPPDGNRNLARAAASGTNATDGVQLRKAANSLSRLAQRSAGTFDRAILRIEAALTPPEQPRAATARRRRAPGFTRLGGSGRKDG